MAFYLDTKIITVTYANIVLTAIKGNNKGTCLSIMKNLVWKRNNFNDQKKQLRGIYRDILVFALAT